MITKVSFDGLGRGSGSYDLERLNLLLGPSGSGKTSVERAVNIGLLGYDPGVGKTLADVFRFASGNPMTIELQVGDTSIRRILTREKSSGSQQILIDGVRVSAEKAKDRIKELLELPVTLNLSEFLGLSDDKKFAFLYSLGQGDYRREEVAEAVVLALVGTKAFALARRDGATFDEMCKTLFDDGERTAVLPIFRFIETSNSLDDAIQQINTSINLGRARGKTLEEAVAGLVRRQQAVSGNLEEIREKVAKLRITASQLSVEIGRAETAQQALAQREQMKDRLTLNHDKLALKICDLKSRVGDPAGVERLHAIVADQHATEIGQIVEEISKLENTIASLPKGSPLGTSCPACNHPFYVDNASGAPTELWACAVGNDKHAKLQAELIAARARRSDLERSLQANDADRVNSLKEIESTRQSLKVAQEELASVDRDLAELSKLNTTITSETANLSDLRTFRDATNAQIEADQRQIEALVAASTMRVEIAHAKRDISTTEQFLDVASKALGALKQLRNRHVADFTSALGSAVEGVLAGIGEMALGVDGGKCVIRCRNVSGQMVDFQALSGGESVIYVAALVCGLIALAKPRGIRLLQLELGELSGNLVVPLLSNLGAMAEALQIQVIAASCHTDFVPPENWKFFQCGKTASDASIAVRNTEIAVPSI